ncbi:hypothetical protein MLD38_032124 [Melastoma candidum]|uniref:Uncharacterized protein n=1 Tax=Melastoma candidum TaxID=119954 RepID=A0ACB9M3Z1_9MYRT|nr:hypothetical protein MLD38_032124 [Melastoma candidum]
MVMGFDDGNVVAADAVEFDVLGRDDVNDDDIACGNQSFCQLLLSNDGEVELEHSFRFSPPPPLFHHVLPASSSSSCRSTSSSSSGLLCFGSTVEGDESLPFQERMPAKRKRDDGRRVRKKPNSSDKGKKEKKLGERVAALQQLVSPFGKTDTASVLHEAMGYIKFLQEQVQVLCTPYLQRHHHPQLPPPDDSKGEGGGSGDPDLRSQGLCLVPMACCVHVQGSGIGADFWSSSTMRRDRT